MRTTTTPFRLLSKIVIWSLVSLAGAGALAIVAFARGEPVNALWLVLASACFFAISYRFYSKWLATKVLVLDENRATPACLINDGKDFVPTNRWVVFGHHFAAIAGPGPLVGPVLAAQFGYLPGALWILIGATLAGGVHDAMILFCSVRRSGRSLGQMVRDEVGPFAGGVALVSVTAIIIILIAVLGLVVVNALAESPWGVFTIAMTMPIALLMGIAIRFAPRYLWLTTIFGVAALLASVWFGQYVKDLPWLHSLMQLDPKVLAWAIIIYGFAASALPVWLLLAPRDYLSTFMKIGTIALLAVAIIVVAPPLRMPALTKFIDGTGLVFAGPVFPFCFITIACAAVSGFHALISSGTTPKLLMRESGIRSIGYGAMIVEMLVGIMALIAACAMVPGEYFAMNVKGEPAAVVQKVTAAGFPVTEADMTHLATQMGENNLVGRPGGATTFAVGMAQMFSGILRSDAATSLWYHFAIMFEALFILTTIDAGTRVGRFLMQDLLGSIWKPLANTRSTLANLVASGLFVAAWGWFLYQGVIDQNGGIRTLWPIFGIANQLLAVIALSLGATVLIKMGRVRYIWVMIAPLAFLLSVTVSAGYMKIFSPDPALGFLSAAGSLRTKIAAGGSVAELTAWNQMLMNQYINTAVTALFITLVLLIVGACVREWFLLLTKRKVSKLTESDYVSLEQAEALAR